MNIKIQSIKYGLMTLVTVALAACGSDISVDPKVNTDATGNKLKQFVAKRTVFSGGNVFGVHTETYNYNQQGQEVSYTLHTGSDEGSEPAVERLTAYTSFGKKKTSGLSSYEYDAKQRLVKEQYSQKITRYYYDGDETKPNKVTIHMVYEGSETFKSATNVFYQADDVTQIDSLDEQGDVISQKFISYSATGKLLESKTLEGGETYINERNQYDQDDKIIIKELGIDESGYVARKKVYSYYPDGEFQSWLVTIRNPDSGTLSFERYSFGYVTQNNIQTTYRERDVGNDGSIDEYREIDADPSQLFNYPNDKSNEKVIKDLEMRRYDAGRQLIDLHVYRYSYW